jgi:hypothetical protein
VPADRPRLLARRSEVGYVESTSAAIPHEPEAVGADVQELLSERGRRAAEDRRRQALQAELDAVKRALNHYEAQARHCSRQLARLERRLGGSP